MHARRPPLPLPIPHPSSPCPLCCHTPAGTPCLTLSPVSIASGKFYVCIRNWIFALVMEMRKLQLDLFFTGLSWLGLSRLGLVRSGFGLVWLLVGVREKWQHAQHSAQLHLHCLLRSISAAAAAESASASVFFVAVYGFLVMILPSPSCPYPCLFCLCS